jgi:uncharacterized cysteine cluster protein YcgN (CxxCxxCC family)
MTDRPSLVQYSIFSVYVRQRDAHSCRCKYIRRQPQGVSMVSLTYMQVVPLDFFPDNEHFITYS